MCTTLSLFIFIFFFTLQEFAEVIKVSKDHMYIIPSQSYTFGIIPLQVEEECGGIPMVLVQNKIDLIDQAVVKV